MRNLALQTLADQLADDKTISADEALELRKAVFPDGVVSREEAEMLISLAARVANSDAAWSHAFVEAITDHVLAAGAYPGHVDEATVSWLTTRFGKEGPRETEVEAVLKILERAESAPEYLSAFARERVGALLALAPVGAAETETVRRCLYASSGSGPESDRSLEALFPVLDGAMPVVFNATTENEITRALDLAKEFNLKALIGGGLEAWKVADRLKAQNVPVLLSLNFPKRTAAASPDADPESLETLRLRAEIPKGAGVLAQKGVRFAFQSGGLTSPVDFFANASKSVENGLSKDAALRAMTLSAAEILGVDNRLGSIETGKIANLTVTRGDIFGKDRQVTHVFVDGRLFEQKERPKAPPVANTPNATTTPALASVAGAWQITLEIPGQQLPGKLDLKQDGAIVSGTISTDATGSSPIKDGKATADGLSFSTTVTFGGATFDISVNGKVSGNQITGTLDSPQGAIPFSGTKIP